MGSNFADGKGNAVVFFGYKNDEALLQSERDFSSCALNTASGGTAYACGGSSTSASGRFFGANGEDLTTANAAGGARPFNAATDLYNFGPLNYFQRPSERYQFNAFAHMDVSPNARVYTEFSFHDDHTVAQIAPSGLFGVQTTVNFENPLLSSSWRNALGLTGPGTSNDTLILRRNVEGGGRQDDIRHTSYRGIIGVKGDAWKNWNYDVYGTLGRVVYQETYKNDFSIARSQRALDVVTDPATGQPACRSAVDGSDPNCVPYNVWATGGVTPAALAYLQTPGLQEGLHVAEPDRRHPVVRPGRLRLEDARRQERRRRRVRLREPQGRAPARHGFRVHDRRPRRPGRTDDRRGRHGQGQGLLRRSAASRSWRARTWRTS